MTGGIAVSLSDMDYDKQRVVMELRLARARNLAC